jgi:hypothetical protein
MQSKHSTTERNSSSHKSLRDAALDYIERGWPVLPLHNPTTTGCSCGDSRCQRVGKHPRIANGYRAATTDRAQIIRWWTKWPDANIGIVVGPACGMVVVDVDGPKGIRALFKLLGTKTLPDTLTTLTGRININGNRVGAHLYYALPEGLSLKNTNGALGEGLEVKVNGYVVAPPSRHASGLTYKWRKSDALLLPAPDWITTGSFDPGEDYSHDDSGPIPEGRRDNTLYRLGKRLRWSGLSETEVELELLKVNTDRCEPALDLDHVQQIAANVFTYSNEESLLDKAWARVQSASIATRREKFIALAQELQKLRPGKEIFLAVKPLSLLLGCSTRQVTSLIRWAMRHDIVERMGDYIPHVKPYGYRVTGQNESMPH